MATIILSAVGAAFGSAFGGSVLGLTGAVIGRAVGATLGRALDQKILGNGSEAIDYGKVDRFRIMGASEGAALPQVWGRVRAVSYTHLDVYKRQTNGTVTFTVAPDIGTAVTAGFEFDVPVRFDADRVQTSVAAFNAGDLPNVPVIEVRL